MRFSRLLSFPWLVALSLVGGLMTPPWAAAPEDSGLLASWTFDEGRGPVARDRSGNGLDAQVRAEWAPSPAGSALALDGTAQRVARVAVPPALRPGTNSWTFLAWVLPHELTYPGAMNQRRLFAYGRYPEASMVIDLTGAGLLSAFLSYRNPEGRMITAGCTALQGVKTGKWAHVAVVCDRAAGRLFTYVNGHLSRAVSLPREFAGDFSLGETLTLGSTWQNYHGLLDAVKLYRRALTRAEVSREFERLEAVFQPAVAPEQRLARRRAAYADDLSETAALWRSGQWSALHALCERLIGDSEAPPAVRSYAHLRLVQSLLARGETDAARAALARLADEPAYPLVHRAEARERLRELDRQVRKLPPRDPDASRTPVPAVERFDAEIFVSPNGDDSREGTRARPLASVHRARDLVRELRARGTNGPIAVTFLPGVYPVNQTWELGPEDSGTANGPVVYRAQRKGTAVIYGGRELDRFVPVTDPAVLARLPNEARGRVVQCDLRALGITNQGELRVRGFSMPPSPPTVEVFFNGRPLTLARWPNEGFVRVRRVVDPGSVRARRPSVFEYESDRHARWVGVKDVWVFGYFRYLWADAALPVAAIDPAARTVTTAEPYSYGGGMSNDQGIIYYVFNLLEELDAPGEWYLDRERGMLYLWPPSSLRRARVEIGLWDHPLAVFRRVSHVRLEGLTFDLARYHGLLLEHCENVLLAACTISRLAGNGISIQGGRSNLLFGCDIRLIGRRGTEVIGGDRAQLLAGNHLVENCQIHDVGRLDRTYTPAIQLEGVRNRVAHNLLYNCPSSVLRIEGNDHLIEFNDIHSAVQESDDQGAMELFGNPTYRGVVFRYNRFRNIGKTGTEPFVHGQAAIRFDDAISGMLVYGNLFIRSARGNFGAVQINGGRDNIIDNNLFVECSRGITGGWYPDNPVWRSLREGRAPATFFTNDLYRARYPTLAHLLDPDGVNHYWRNMFYRCDSILGGNLAHVDALENVEFSDADPGFVNAAAGDYRLRPDAPVFSAVAFRPLPLEHIGLYRSDSRATWPVKSAPANR